jgi:hypothetical protein
MPIRILLILMLLVSAARTAPPSVTYLYPAGGQRGKAVEVTAAGTFERWPVKAWVEGKGVEVKPGKAKGKFTVTIADDAAPGPRWLRLYDEQGGSALRRFIVGTLPEAPGQEPNDDPAAAQKLAGDAVVNGKLAKAGDVDCFAVQLGKGQTLVASVDAQRHLLAPMDAVLQVVSDKGFVLAQNNDHRGLDPQVTLRVPEEGRYTVRVFAFPAVPDASVRFAGGDNFVYRLTVTASGFADHAFPLAVERARPAPVELVGWNIPDASRKVAVAAGDEDEARAFARDVAGTADVRLEPHACTTYSGDRKSPQSLTLPVTVSGKLFKPGEVHAYRFPARKGQRVLFQVESASLGFAIDPALKVRNGSGSVVAESPSAGRALARDAELAVTAPADGDYVLELTDLYEDAGPRHLYRLRATLAEPDFALTVRTDQFALTSGKTLDVPVAVERRNGFKEKVEIAAEGLPQGVRAEVVSGTTLRLTADAKVSAAGPLRIVGRVKGQSRIARAALADFAVSVPHLWLTVGESATAPAPAPRKKRR